MTSQEVIKQEIKRRIDLYSIAEKNDSIFARMGELSSLIDFIESLSEDFKIQYKSNIGYQHAYSQNDMMKIKNS